MNINDFVIKNGDIVSIFIVAVILVVLIFLLASTFFVRRKHNNRVIPFKFDSMLIDIYRKQSIDSSKVNDLIIKDKYYMRYNDIKIRIEPFSRG